jgi:hypothetical protein
VLISSNVRTVRKLGEQYEFRNLWIICQQGEMSVYNFAIFGGMIAVSIHTEECVAPVHIPDCS